MAKGPSTQSVCGMLGPVGTAGGSLADTARLDTHMALSPLTCPRHNMEQKAHTGEDSQPCSQHRLLQRKSRCTSIRKETTAAFSVCPSAAAGPARNVPSGVSLGSEGYFFQSHPRIYLLIGESERNIDVRGKHPLIASHTCCRDRIPNPGVRPDRARATAFGAQDNTPTN